MFQLRRQTGSPLRVVGLFCAYALVHSVLASRPVKRAVRRVIGSRAEQGLYRGFYNIQAVATTGLATLLFVRLPDREFYRVRGPLAVALIGVQLAGVALILGMIKNVGFLRLSGLAQAIAFFTQADNIPQVEAQGPAPASHGAGIDVTGPFRYIRHPENLGIVLLFAGFRRISLNRLTLLLLGILYAVIGSWHEDYRLRVAYGDSFERYRRRTPMLLPKAADGPR